MRTNYERLPTPRLCLAAVPLNNREILVSGATETRHDFREIFTVEKSTPMFTQAHAPALKGYEINQAVRISNNKIVAFAFLPSLETKQIISYTKDANPAIEVLKELSCYY